MTRYTDLELPAERVLARISLAEFRTVNVARCEEVFHPLADWSPTDWACALAGEVGEACNLIKKLRRLSGPTWKRPEESREAGLIAALSGELADSFTYLDLTAARLGIDLGRAAMATFNGVSIRTGSRMMFAPRPLLPRPDAGVFASEHAHVPAGASVDAFEEHYGRLTPLARQELLAIMRVREEAAAHRALDVAGVAA